MCGIFGVLSSGSYALSSSSIQEISCLLNRRGPDDTGFLTYAVDQGRFCSFKDPVQQQSFQLFFLHKRLSIIDLSSMGHQPMVSEDGRYALIFNGEIYNYRTLKTDLERQGVRFQSHSDTEVLLNHLAMYGSEGISSLEGMFAFAFFDRKENSLLLARDAFGIKPLFVYQTPSFFAFSSQINALLELDAFKTRFLETDNYFDFLRFGLTDFNEKTLVKNVHHLLPGHSLKIQLEREGLVYTQKKYFQLGIGSQTGEPISFENATKTTRMLLDESVQLHMNSDVPICFNLSGGVDSSALLALASQHRKDLTAFTYVADEAAISEEKYAAIVAKHLGVNLIRVKIDPNDFIQDLDDIIRSQGEPYGGSSIYAQRKLYEAQRKQGFKVSIDGQGGDELFAGYANYSAFFFLELLRSKDYMKAFKFLLTSGSYNTSAPLKAILGYSLNHLLQSNLKLKMYCRKLMGRGLIPFHIDGDFFKKRQLIVTQTNDFKTLREFLADSLTRSSIPHLVRYADRNAMTFSIENRVPFLLSGIAKWANALPSHFLISEKGVSKYILRESVRDLLPTSILDRKDKLGFPPTEGLWLMTHKDAIKKIFASDVAQSIPGLNIKAIRKQWDQISLRGDPKAFRSDFVWKALNLIKWVEFYRISF
jgi:asparagine synthase (glutamine-hydrolysing)